MDLASPDEGEWKSEGRSPKEGGPCHLGSKVPAGQMLTTMVRGDFREVSGHAVSWVSGVGAPGGARKGVSLPLGIYARPVLPPGTAPLGAKMTHTWDN